MRNYIQDGNVLTLPAPADVLSGAGALIGSIFGVAQTDGLNGVDTPFLVTGVVDLPKTNALAIAIGDKVYWDNTAKVVNKTVSGNTLVGVATTAAANPSSTVNVRLNASFA